MEKIKIVQVGLGPLGQKIVSYALQRNQIELVAAVDNAEDKAGKYLSELCPDIKQFKIDMKILSDINSAVKNNKPDVALLTTVSGLEAITGQIELIARQGIHVVSTCEELSFPWGTNPALAKKIDEIGKKYNISILSTGVNPGFLMDFLPIALTAVCCQVKSIKVSRIQDASTRRVPFQKKIGAGLTLEQFEQKRQTGTLRHVGLTESMHMIAAKLGWKLSKTEEILTPIVAGTEILSGYMPIKPGIASGVRQTGRGYVNGRERITLEFRASVGENDPADTIEIKGIPDITSTIKGGINGDIATCAVVVNAVKSIITAAPGLRAMADIPVVSFNI